MKNTWKKKTALGVLSASLLMGSAYTQMELHAAESLGGKVSAAQSKAVDKVSYKTTAPLNMRAGASIHKSVIGYLPKGATVTPTNKIGIWYKVSYKGKTGYVSKNYLKQVSDSATKPAPSVSGKNYTTTERLNMRTGASINHKWILTIPNGKNVTYLAKSGSWFKVKYGTKTGWVHSGYLKAASSATPSTPTPPPSVDAKSYTTTTALNMRTGGSVKYKVIVTIPGGNKVQYLAKSGDWFKVKYGSKTGWVHGGYLKADSGSAQPEKPKPEAPKGKIFATTDNLNLRTGGSVRYPILVNIPKGGQIEALSTSGTWYKVSYKGKVGYVHSGYLKAVDTKPSNPAEPPNWKPTLPKQDVMSRTEAENHLSGYLTKHGENGYRLVSGLGDDSVTVGLESTKTGKGNIGIYLVNYLSGYHIQPEDFGEDAYADTKAHLAKMDAAILAFAETQFGKGSSDAQEFATKFKHMAIKGKHGDVKTLTMQGQKVVIKYDRSTLMASY